MRKTWLLLLTVFLVGTLMAGSAGAADDRTLVVVQEAEPVGLPFINAGKSPSRARLI